MAVHFSKAIPAIRCALQTHKLLFCLDFDGTLAPIRRDPDAVKPSARLIAFLEKAARLPNCGVVIISGRSLSDLKRRIPVRGITLAGSHGLEWSTRVRKKSNRSGKLKKIQKLWQTKMHGIKGIHFESKPYSFVMHYRRCRRNLQKKAVEFFMDQEAMLLKHGFEWTPAHKAFEVFEEARGRKEQMSREFMRRFGHTHLIAAGDDATDFGMLAMAETQGWAVTVGFSRAGIAYFVKGPGELVRLLNQTLSRRSTKKDR